jgi:hypothetical protein
MHIQSNPVSNQQDFARLTNLPVLDHVPLEALHIYAQGRQRGEKDDSLDTDLFAFVMFRLSCPTQEISNVLGHL